MSHDKEESFAAVHRDVELGKLPVASSTPIKLSGSSPSLHLQNQKNGGGGPTSAATKTSTATSLRWNIRKLSVPIKKKHIARLQGNFELLGQPGGNMSDTGGPFGSNDGSVRLATARASGRGSQSSFAALNGGNGMKAERNILYNVVGHAEKGQMLALMGASGAGKSSLLDCISLRNHRFEGCVYLDRNPVDTHFFSSTAYVHQVDMFFATLTVREHLTFHAMVRVRKEVAVADRLRRVEEVIEAVNLSKCAESLIGGPQAFIRGISGGERKRLSVATELLSDPEIIFADEPTSGLDAFMALSGT